ncbi:hypothetical protein DL98DRAFT_257302 [Cadophora sp. DSE1049]|nr:hypothetical protein DL98DRAFT_257302 [Cadophora sp. DSE1049]
MTEPSSSFSLTVLKDSTEDPLEFPLPLDLGANELWQELQLLILKHQFRVSNSDQWNTFNKTQLAIVKYGIRRLYAVDRIEGCFSARNAFALVELVQLVRCASDRVLGAIASLEPPYLARLLEFVDKLPRASSERVIRAAKLLKDDDEIRTLGTNHNRDEVLITDPPSKEISFVSKSKKRRSDASVEKSSAPSKKRKRKGLNHAPVPSQDPPQHDRPAGDSDSEERQPPDNSLQSLGESDELRHLLANSEDTARGTEMTSGGLTFVFDPVLVETQMQEPLDVTWVSRFLGGQVPMMDVIFFFGPDFVPEPLAEIMLPSASVVQIEMGRDTFRKVVAEVNSATER